MTRHLKDCLKKQSIEGTSHKEKENIFLIKLFSRKEYWLYIEINGSAQLGLLDEYLRDIWLECCGHMSHFYIRGEYYDCNESMSKKINKVLSADIEFDYEYDYGSTTRLEGKVVLIRSGSLKEKIRLLARNNLSTEMQCVTCKKIPEVVCTDCSDFFCEVCKEDHEDEEYMLPIVNSPRMGICGYTGD